MVMNYQAALLHNQQQAAASLALNFSVIESLIKEIFHAYGIINGTEIKSFIDTKREYEFTSISKNEFRRMRLVKLIKILNDGGLIDDYGFNRIEKLRKKRNKLMHKGMMISPLESGDAQTLVCNYWSHLVDTPFELNANWSYMR